MPFYSSILDVCVPAQDVPETLQFFSDVSSRYSDAHPSSHTSSRRTVASQNLDNLVREYAAGDLAYLSDALAVLDPARIERAIAGLEQLFDGMRAEPERAARCSVYECSSPEVVAASQLPEVAPVPDSLRDDDGESMPYAIAYLKAHLAVLRHAREHRLFVLHGKSHDLDGTEV